MLSHFFDFIENFQIFFFANKFSFECNVRQKKTVQTLTHLKIVKLDILFLIFNVFKKYLLFALNYKYRVEEKTQTLWANTQSIK